MGVLDVTERREAEAATLAALEQQRHMNDLLSRFVSMTSHEFRTPLAAIFSSAEILRCYAARLGEDDKEDLYDSIEAGVRRMTTMLDNVLEFGRAQTGRMEFAPASLDLRRLCEDIVGELTRAQPAHEGVACAIELAWGTDRSDACVDVSTSTRATRGARSALTNTKSKQQGSAQLLS